MRPEQLPNDEPSGHAHDWEGFMAYHNVGLFCRVLRWSHEMADHLAARAATWWLRRHPEQTLGHGATRRG